MPDSHEPLQCKLLLDGVTLRQAQAEAASELLNFLMNPRALAAYGLPVLDELNQLIATVLSDAERSPAGSRRDDAKPSQELLKKLTEELGDRFADDFKLDQFYHASKIAIPKLIYTIAVMELVEELIGQEAPAATSNRRIELEHLASDLNAKISISKDRVYLAWAFLPKIRQIQALNSAVAERIIRLQPEG